MPKANPFAQISKRVASLQAKSAKINDELGTLSKVVAVEMKKLADAPASVPAKPAAKPAAAKTAAPKGVAPKAAAPKTTAPTGEPKKKGRPAKK